MACSGDPEGELHCNMTTPPRMVQDEAPEQNLMDAPSMSKSTQSQGGVSVDHDVEAQMEVESIGDIDEAAAKADELDKDLGMLPQREKDAQKQKLSLGLVPTVPPAALRRLSVTSFDSKRPQSDPSPGRRHAQQAWGSSGKGDEATGWAWAPGGPEFGDLSKVSPVPYCSACQCAHPTSVPCSCKPRCSSAQRWGDRLCRGSAPVKGGGQAGCEGSYEDGRPPTRDIADELRLGAARLFRDAERRAVRSAGQVIGTLECQTFLCLICFENQSCDKRLNISSCKVEAHSCCNECASSFFQSRIQQGRVFELYCPIGAADGGCALGGEVPSEPAAATREEVEKVMGDDRITIGKYHRFLQTKVDSSLRECPDCQILYSPILDAEGRPRPDMTCTSCGSSFCYFHAAAHRDTSCEEYEVCLTAETKRISEAFGTKDCPQCTRQTMKSGGCNHMTCQVCRCEWCWICGEIMTIRGPHSEDPVYWHYSDENVDSGCQQFAEPGAHPDAEAVRLRRRDRRPTDLMRRIVVPVRFLAVSLLVTCVLIALVLWMMFYSLSFAVADTFVRIAQGAQHPCEHVEGLDQARTQKLVKPTLYFAALIGTVLFLTPFIPLTLAWGILASVIWVNLWAMSHAPVLHRFFTPITQHHWRFLAFAPHRAVHQFGNATFARLAERARDAQPQ